LKAEKKLRKILETKARVKASRFSSLCSQKFTDCEAQIEKIASHRILLSIPSAQLHSAHCQPQSFDAQQRHNDLQEPLLS
jgi:hypothetical protein